MELSARNNICAIVERKYVRKSRRNTPPTTAGWFAPYLWTGISFAPVVCNVASIPYHMGDNITPCHMGNMMTHLLGQFFVNNGKGANAERCVNRKYSQRRHFRRVRSSCGSFRRSSSQEKSSHMGEGGAGCYLTSYMKIYSMYVCMYTCIHVSVCLYQACLYICMRVFMY